MAMVVTVGVMLRLSCSWRRRLRQVLSLRAVPTVMPLLLVDRWPPIARLILRSVITASFLMVLLLFISVITSSIWPVPTRSRRFWWEAMSDPFLGRHGPCGRAL